MSWSLALFQATKKIAEFLKTFQPVAKALAEIHGDAIQSFDSLETVLESDAEDKLQKFRALFAEGIFLFAHCSVSQRALPAARNQLSQIAGEKIPETYVQIALLERARELTRE